jgi:hypothetical protein
MVVSVPVSQDELHRVSVDHEDQAAGEEPLGGHRARRCHAARRPNSVGRHHQRGAAGDAGIADGEGAATEAWKAVRSLRIDSEAIRNTRARRLRTEFESIRFKEGETVDDFTMRLDSLVTELGTLGEMIKEQQVVQKLLRVILKHLS